MKQQSAQDLLREAEAILGKKEVNSMLNCSIVELHKKNYQAYQAFKDEQMKAYQNIIKYRMMPK